MEATIHEVAAWLLGTFGAAVFGWLAKKLGDLIASKVSHEYAREALGRFNEAAIDAVLEVEQTYVSKIKTGKAPDSDGGTKLTDAEIATAKRAAIEALRSNLGPKGISRLMYVLGIDVGQANKVMERKVEAKLGALRASEVASPLPRGVSLKAPSAG